MGYYTAVIRVGPPASIAIATRAVAVRLTLEPPLPPAAGPGHAPDAGRRARLRAAGLQPVTAASHPDATATEPVTERRVRHVIARHVTPPATVAAEHTPGYDSGGQPAGNAAHDPAVAPTAAQALAQLDAALAALARVDFSAEPDGEVNTTAVALQRRVNQLQALALRPLSIMSRRETYRGDGAVTAASWLRVRTRMDAPAAARLCTAARRLTNLPLLRQAFLRGDVTLAHVTAITEAAVPNRYEAIRAVEQPLVELASRRPPRPLHTALRRVRDIADPDGSEPTIDGDDEVYDADENDPRRFWEQHLTHDGMLAGRYLVDGVFGAMLATLFDAYSTADPDDTPLQRRRVPAQQRCDAMRAAVLALLNAGITPTVQGNKPHLLLMVDLHTVMGRDQAAVFTAELARYGRVSPATIARLGIDAKITPVLTMGPYRVVAVGRTQRTLPAWLRPLLAMLHQRCRGPDCDRPVSWCQAHHEHPWADGGDTDLNATIPLCQAHHDLVTHHGWTVTLNTNTGICTWTNPNGQITYTYPHR
jgi:hypothetical protein